MINSVPLQIAPITPRFYSLFSEHTAVPSVSVTSTSHPLFTINCVTSGAPTVVTWNYQSGDLIYQNDEGHQIVHSLQDGTAATYHSAIAFTFIPVNETGVHACETETTYISSDTTETNTATGTIHN